MIIQIEPWIDGDELTELRKVIESTYVTEHHATAKFEEMCRELTGSKHAIAMTNGTMALFAALKSLEIGPGDEVIVPDMTFIATANAVILAGATPVFCDVDPSTFCLDPKLAELRITKNTKAIMPVHLYGQAAEMGEIISLAKKFSLRVIEDAAQGVGVRSNGQHVGTFGDIGVLSFYGNKTITCGEGGVIITDDALLAKKCYMLKNHGREKKGVFIHEEIGFNFAFTEMQAAIGISQLKKLQRIIDKKKAVKVSYDKGLADIKGLRPCVISPVTSDPVHWFTSFLADDVEGLGAWLLDRHAIQTRRFFYPLHLQPCYLKNNALNIGNPAQYINANYAYSKGISLPSSYNLTKSDQEIVISAVRTYFEDRH